MLWGLQDLVVEDVGLEVMFFFEGLKGQPEFLQGAGSLLGGSWYLKTLNPKP